MNISHLFSSHRGASLLLSLFLAASASAQRSLDLAGSWTMADGKKANLPGSKLMIFHQLFAQCFVGIT